MTQPLSFVDFDLLVANLLRTVTGTLLEVYAEIVANIEAADLSPEEKISLLSAAQQGLNERLDWHPPVHIGRPAKEYDRKKAVLAAPYASLSRKERKGSQGPVDRYVAHLGGKNDGDQ